MKKSVLVQSCLILLLLVGICFNVSPGMAKEDLVPIPPILVTMPDQLQGDIVSRRPVLLAQADNSDSNTVADNALEKAMSPKDRVKKAEDFEKDDFKGDGVEEDLFAEYDNPVADIQMVADPLYYFNYAMYSFNDFLYFYALKPVTRGYSAVVPVIVRKGINNFFFNLMFPVRFINNIFQGKLNEASDEIGVFLANSTLGVLGFNQFAQKHLNMKTSDEDLGQTLGSYSIGDGFYLVLPILGPSTLRDAIGRAGDYFITPVNYVEPWELDLGVNITDKINRTSFRIGDYEALKDASLDPYVAFRNAYIQNRRSEIEK